MGCPKEMGSPFFSFITSANFLHIKPKAPFVKQMGGFIKPTHISFKKN